MYAIVLHKQVVKFINARTPKEKEKIKEKFLLLQENPFPSGVGIDSKKMQNRNGYRLGVGTYRFIYEVVKEELLIYMEEANNRGDIY